MRGVRSSLLVLFAGCVAHAQATAPAPEAKEELTSYRFDGQLGYRTSEGAWIALVPDAVFVGWGEGGCEPAAQEPDRIGFYADGKFRMTISEGLTQTHVLAPDGTFGPTISEIMRWPCYRFRVDGCDDVTVAFGPKPPGRSIEMQCPGRETKPRREG